MRKDEGSGGGQTRPVQGSLKIVFEFIFLYEAWRRVVGRVSGAEARSHTPAGKSETGGETKLRQTTI